MEKLKKIWIKLVKLCGWKFNLPEKGSRHEVERCVFVVAPHTSAWDFIIGATYLWSCCSNGKIFIAKEFFFWPLGPFLRGLGAISIDRKSRTDHMVNVAVEEFKKNEQLSIVITPEGTRRAIERWKNGFWEIAHRANVPIVLAYVDFKKKEMGLFDTIIPSDNREADVLKVRKYYKKEMAKYPDKFIELGIKKAFRKSLGAFFKNQIYFPYLRLF